MILYVDDSAEGLIARAEKHEFKATRRDIIEELLKTEPQNFGKWQSLDISQSSAHATYELLNVQFQYQMPQSRVWAQEYIDPDLPWAENHFLERVGGKPINPGVEHANWPYHAGKVELHQHGGKYDHNYMERFWPKTLRYEYYNGDPIEDLENFNFTGYRFSVGDLNDVIQQLQADSGTRQAYLPVWFPEDTGATEGQRVPCTLGYHFIIRDSTLFVSYNLRSCEIYRHFTNDIYMAVRLAQHVGYQVGNLRMGKLTTNIVSLHGFVGDKDKIERML